MIDCGYTYNRNVVQHFRDHKTHQIDALLLTHEHHDAISGLDQLRGWTRNGSFQKVVDIYMSRRTLQECETRFAWLFKNGGSGMPSRSVSRSHRIELLYCSRRLH